jgi:predicted peptidase
MGGNGTWKFAAEHPERFAAIAPMASGADVKQAAKFKDLPVWTFYGAKDKAMGLETSQKMVDAIKDLGGNAKLTVYPDAGHDCWTVSYDNPELYTWLLQYKRSPKK